VIGMAKTDYYCPFYDQPHRQRSLEGGQNAGVKGFSHDLKRVH
jgi:hypothetical protein